VLQPDGTSVAMSYLPTGEMQQTSGSRTYPVGYSYDYGGRMLTMTNWTNFSTGGGARVTTWGYSPTRGFLSSKTDAAGKAVSYTYTPAGRLLTRTWARGTNATYGYDTGGQLASVTYSDSTPGLTNLRDRLGRVTSTVCNGTTTSFAYDLANDVLGEWYSGGTLGGLKITNQFDADLRRTNTALFNGATSLCQAIYGYDNASRLSTVSDGVNNAAYTYLANSSLVGQIAFKSNTVARMTTTKQYDYLNRLTSISSTPSNAFSYLYNAANQRTLAWNWDSSYWRYNYDSLGQVTQGNKYWVDQTIVAGQQFNYTFDNIGNRTQTQIGGDQNGANLRVANYTNNNLNQITSRGVPAYVDIMGDGLATNGVTVNGSNAYRKNEFFRQQLPVTNTSAVWDGITVSATGQGSVTGHMYVAQNPENYTYDADGNLLSDGRWNYTWDAENRLLSMTSLSGAPSGSLLQLTFAYDYQGRRIQKAVSTNTGGGNFSVYTNKYAYDGWNCVATMNPSFTLSNTFLWGSDLSGSLQGAGGVGGLIKVAYYGTTTTNAFVAYDGNGNVSALVSAATGSTVANYEYGPFGEVIRATGPMAKLNPFRFSTKYDDDETDLLYYGYRYYKPSTGTWLCKDPIGERGGPNLYGFVGNDPQDRVDLLGEDINLPPGGNPIQPWPYSPIPITPPPPPPPPGGWWGAILNTIDWALGGQPGTTYYGPNSSQSQEMSQSAIASQVRQFFLNKNQNKLCKDWQGATDVGNQFRVTVELPAEWANGTAELVGRARGDVTIVSVVCPPGHVVANFKLTNTTSLTSLLYGLWPNGLNPTTPGLPFANWTQIYTWNEVFNCNCCNP
jgi:RHS repeat-associated protein